jgi:RNA polymerase sigma-70 factor (ECF subfamily)
LVKQLLEHRDGILGFLFALTRDYDVSEELFQVVATTILEEAGRGTTVEQFLPWAREIARRRVREYYRTHTRREALEQPEAALEEVVCQAFAENEDACETDQLRLKCLLECLERLTGRSRQVIEGFYRQRKSIRELADALAWQEGSVKVALVRARKALAECVQARMRLEGVS